MTQTPGRVVWIGVRPARFEKGGIAEPLEHVEARPGKGLVGDRFTPNPASKDPTQREVTLINFEDLAHVGKALGFATGDEDPGDATTRVRTATGVDPRNTRRNIVIAGCDVRFLDGRRFRIGSALLEGTSDCAPCDKMERTIGPGARDAMTVEGAPSRGGLTARVLEAGEIKLGDALEPIE